MAKNIAREGEIPTIGRFLLHVPIIDIAADPLDAATSSEVKTWAWASALFIVRVIDKRTGEEVEFDWAKYKEGMNVVHPLLKRKEAHIQSGEGNFFAYPYVPVDADAPVTAADEHFGNVYPASVRPLFSFFDFKFDKDTCQVIPTPRADMDAHSNYAILLAQNGIEAYDEECGLMPRNEESAKELLSRKGAEWWYAPEKDACYFSIADDFRFGDSTEALAELEGRCEGGTPYFSSTDMTKLPDGWGESTKRDEEMFDWESRSDILATYGRTIANIGSLEITAEQGFQFRGADNVIFHATIKPKSGDELEMTVVCDIFNIASYGSNAFCALDSISDDLGETAFQLYANTGVSRQPYKEGLLVFIRELICPDEMRTRFAEKDNALRAVAEGILSMVTESIYPLVCDDQTGKKAKTVAQLAYYGLLYPFDTGDRARNRAILIEAREDSEWLVLFQSNDFATFRCINGICSDGENYIALYDASVIGNSKARHKQNKQTEWEPTVIEPNLEDADF